MWLGGPFNMRLQPVILSFMAIAFGGLRAEVCKTPGCLEIAKVFKDSMDTSVDPCENFYQFTCGNFIKKTVIPDWKDEYDVDSKVENNIHQQLKHELEAKTISGQPPSFQLAKDYYHSCMDTESIEKNSIINVIKRLDSYGKWPVLAEDCDDDNVDDFDWLSTTKKLMEDGQLTDQIVIVSLEYDTKWMIVIDDGRHYLDDDTLKEGLENTRVQEYLDALVDIAVAFGADREQAEQDMTDVVQLEIALVNLSHTPIGLPKIPQTISELQEVWPYIPWLDIIRGNFIIDVGIMNSTQVRVLKPHYLANLQKMLPNIPKRTLANYIMSRLIFESRYYLNEEIFNIAWGLEHINDEKEISVPLRWEYCIEDLMESSAVTLAAMYVRKYFDPSMKQEAKKIVDMLKDQFVDIIANEDWLTNETKIQSINKIKNMKDYIGYPEELLNDKLLKQYFEGLNITPRSYYDNYLAFSVWSSIVDARKLQSPADAPGWMYLPIDTTMSVGPIYLLHSNALVLYSGNLQSLFYSADRPMYVNLAILGSAAAMELPIALEDFARENKLNQDSWDKASANEYTKRYQALVDEYSSYVVKEVNMNVVGHNVAYTAIEEHGGNKITRMALDTWQSQIGKQEPKLKGLEKYSEAQIFWMGVALNYCSKSTLQWIRWMIENDDVLPPELSVNGPFRHSEQFSQDWECPVGSYMNPEVKVNMW